MRFSMAESMCDIDHYLPLVQAADEVGFSTFCLGATHGVLFPRPLVSAKGACKGAFGGGTV